MCGRTACTLAPDQVCKASSYPSKANGSKNKFSCPQWLDHPGSHTYSPSTNLAPSMFCPVLIKNPNLCSNIKRDIDDVEKPKTSQYVVQPMRWGFIPPFFKGTSPKEFGFKTSNCRIEGIEEKNMYKSALNKGLRCVVLCEGFYEWQSTKGSKNKQPYFIHAQQAEGVEIWNKENYLLENVWDEEDGWKGPKLLKLAGLYSRWKSAEGEEILSFTIITMESEKTFSWLHHRVPAILESSDDVENWLEEQDYKKAVGNLRKTVSVCSYPVSTLVNNARNKDEHLFVPVSINEKKPETAGSKLMSAWLNSSSQNVKQDQPKTELKQDQPKTELNQDQPKTETKKEEGKRPKGIIKWLTKPE